MITIFDTLLVLAPTAEFGVKGETYEGIEWFSTDIPKPTKEEVLLKQSELEAEEPLKDCKAEAKRRIAESDWSVLPDVGISNVAQFETYRAALRELIKNPVANPSFPAEPEPVWI